jgi:hypothetical protein
MYGKTGDLTAADVSRTTVKQCSVVLVALAISLVLYLSSAFRHPRSDRWYIEKSLLMFTK